jgi:hypothetical protein
MSTRNGLTLTPTQAHERFGEDALDAEFRSMHGPVGEARKVLADKARSIRKAQNALNAIDYLRSGGVSLDSTLSHAVGALLKFQF